VSPETLFTETALLLFLKGLRERSDGSLAHLTS
jgi:hypothetical protein